MTFGEKLQSLRQRSGMSQDALAERLEAERAAMEAQIAEKEARLQAELDRE